MAGNISFFRAQLESLGWPTHLLDTLIKHAKGDNIIGLGMRLALIGLMASAVRLLVALFTTKINQSMLWYLMS